MRWIEDNKGNIFITVIAVMLGVMIGVLVHGFYHRAEAVIGGVGNLTDSAHPHNLSASSGGIHAVTETQICIFCHTPHSSITNGVLINGPLWNHTLSDAIYQVKTANSLISNGTIGIVNMLSSPPSQPDGATRMCMSCHDGTVSLGAVSVGGPIEMAAHSCINAAGALISGAGCNAYIGLDLTQKHVVSIPMNQTLVDASFANCSIGGQTTRVVYPWDTSNVNSAPNTVLLRPTTKLFRGLSGASYTETSGNPKYKAGYSYGLQCSTCHDPHFWANTVDSGTVGYKLIVEPFNKLCQACHVNCP